MPQDVVPLKAGHPSWGIWKPNNKNGNTLTLKFACPLCSHEIISDIHVHGDMFRCPDCGGMSCVPATAIPTDKPPNLLRWKPPPEPPPEPTPIGPEGPRPCGVKAVVLFPFASWAGQTVLYYLFVLAYYAILLIGFPDRPHDYENLKKNMPDAMGALLYLAYIILALWLIYYIVVNRHKNNFFKAMRINKPSTKVIVGYCALAVALYMLNVMVDYLLLSKDLFPTVSSGLLAGSVSRDMIFKMISTTVFGLLAPIHEEIKYRGFIYGGLENKVGKIWAAVITTVWFIVPHVPSRLDNPMTIFWIGVGGSVMMFARIKTDSLTVPITYHFTANLLPNIHLWLILL